RPPEAEARAGARLHREREVVEHAEAPEDAGDLVAAREAGRDARMGWLPGDVGAVEDDAAALGREHAGDLTDQRRLAGAVRPDQRVHLAARHFQGHIVGGDDAAEAFADAPKLKHGGAARRTRKYPRAPA